MAENTTIKCTNGCGFFGNPLTGNYCSKCFKDMQLKNNAKVEEPKRIEEEKETKNGGNREENNGFQPVRGFNNNIPLNLEQQRLLHQRFLEQNRLAQQYGQFQQFRGRQLPQPQFQHQNNNFQQGQGAQDQRQGHRESWVWLVIKLSFMVYLFSQGGSSTRTVILSIGAFLIFLYQIGTFRITTIALTQNNLVVPAGQGGIVNELLLPFFYSLLPTWQPIAQPPNPPVPPIPVPNGVPNG